ncbi:MAG: GDSL-type esterase/lipase family protein [Janthinobacterium lividum]
MRKTWLLSILFLSVNFWCADIFAQQKAPFYDEIQAFKKQDSINPVPKNCTLFFGSSSLRKWTDLEKTFASYHAINRGFGGSTLTDAIYYVNDLVDPYQLKQIVIYSGENDIAEGNVSAEMVLDRFEKLFGLIRQKLPAVPVAFISIKPSPSRAKFQSIVVEANHLIKVFLRKQHETAFIDVYQPMLAKHEQMRPELFLSDMLHMNDAGYDIWIKAIQPHLIK